MSDRVKWMKRVFSWIAIITIAIVAIIGFAFGKIIEGSLIAEVSKWVVMAVVLAGLMCGLAYVPVSVLEHWRHKLYPEYGKDWFKMMFKRKK